MYNDFWMMDNGFIKRERSDDLRDLIGRRHDLGEDYTLSESDPIRNVIKRMGMYGVSQMVVMSEPGPHGKVSGIIDEGDVLLAIHAEGQSGPEGVGEGGVFDRPVSDFMTRRIETIAPEAPVSALMPIFRADRVAIVVDKAGRYYGLITKIDMVNHLRSQLVR
jgi:cystathionine beta-synthase